MILNGKDYITYLKERASDTDSIKITTFFIYENENVGLVRELLSALNASPAKVEIIVGIPYMFRCIDGCPHCFNRSYLQIMKLYDLADEFHRIDWYFRADLHCKMAICSFKETKETIYWYGSKNITDGNSSDLMLQICDKEQQIEVLAMFDKMKRQIYALDFGKYSGMKLVEPIFDKDKINYLGYLQSLGTDLNCKMNTFVSALCDRILNNKRTYNDDGKEIKKN
jgi:hypothetical protein